MGNQIFDLVRAARDNDLEIFFTIIRALISSIPSHLFIKEREAYYHTLIYLILMLIGIYIDVEVHTNKGRIDAVMEMEKRVYVMEFKMGTSNTALTQFEKKGHHQKFLSSGKGIHLIGVGFDAKERNIRDYKQKEVIID